MSMAAFSVESGPTWEQGAERPQDVEAIVAASRQ